MTADLHVVNANHTSHSFLEFHSLDESAGEGLDLNKKVHFSFMINLIF